MIYLIGQLALWLFLTAAFAAIAGWAYAAQRAAPVDAKLRRDREALVRDLSRLAAGEAATGGDVGASVELDALRRQLEVRNSRVVELEGLLSDARGRADEHAAQIAQMQRGLTDQREDDSEMERLRALVASHEEERSREVEVIAEPVEPLIDEETLALQSWRLRYFEQRVKYLEGRAAEAPAAPSIQPVADVVAEEEPTPALAEWRARDAEARAEYLEQQVRALSVPAAPETAEPPAEETAPFAANADVDILLRWRLLYLERRVGYLQADAARAAELALIPVPEPEPEPEPQLALEAGPDPDRWKWRARYLEARLRHLEARPPQVVVQTVAAPISGEAEEEAAAPPSSTTARKPPVLTAARNGAPDDFTLIDSMSALQQSTFNAIGIFHFDQIAAWAPEHVAWVDRYFRLRGRIVQEEWVEQAAELSRHGVAAARRLEHEDA